MISNKKQTNKQTKKQKKKQKQNKTKNPKRTRIFLEWLFENCDELTIWNIISVILCVKVAVKCPLKFVMIGK